MMDMCKIIQFSQNWLRRQNYQKTYADAHLLLKKSDISYPDQTEKNRKEPEMDFYF